MKESKCRIVDIDTARVRVANPDLGPQLPDGSGNRGQNRHTRPNVVRAFVLGNSVLQVARLHNIKPIAVQEQIREELLERGVLVRKAAA